MYLKNIEIQGFKSFAHKLVFEFHDGITAIVGPNGSGKSNIADAVRWVLGEQSAKQLRGTKMEDIIFAGTETRKPLGFAYVAITLDNSDHMLSTSYEEVKVARRVYRSGESEYLMNGNHCRLRDVQELFLDTGIGKEGYSIIGQGQIDKILSGKPEDRRELFDEAAGIVKFKKRKASAEKNIEEERQNLYRINDILTEVEKQVAPLEKQSMVAKEYLKFRDELKGLDVNMFLLECNRIQEELKSIDQKHNIANGDLEDTRSTYENTKEEYEKLEIQIEEYNVDLEEKRNVLSESKVKKEQLEGQVKVLHEKIIASNQNDEHFKGRMIVATTELESKNQELIRYSDKKNEMDDKIKNVHSIQSESDKALYNITKDIEEIASEINRYKEEIFDFLNRNTNIKTKMQRFDTILEQNNIRRATLNQMLLKNKSDDVIYDEVIENEKSRLVQVLDQLEELQNTNDELESEVISINKDIFACRKNAENAQQEFHRGKSRLDSLKNMMERYEGYGQSIRRVMEQKNHTPGILGVVADIIKVSKKYETAIETALGGSIQNIVTDNEASAKQLIEFLKKNKYGRATFLPLTSIYSRNSFQKENALQEKGVIGLASKLVDADNMFSGLLEYLLGRIVVVDHVDNAISLAKKYKHSFKIVTVDGEVLNPGGSISGGAYKNSSNLLSRHREMEDLEIAIKQIEKNLSEKNKEIFELQEDKHVHQEAIEENKSTIQGLYLRQNTAKMKYDQALLAKETTQSTLIEIEKENIDIEENNRNLKNEVLKLKSLLKENEEKSKEKEEEIIKSTGLFNEKKKEETLYKEEIANRKIEISTLEQNNQFILENMNRVEEETSKLKEEISKLERSISDSDLQIIGKKEDINKVKQSIDSFAETIKKLEEDINNIIDLKEEISKNHKEFFSKREDLSFRMNQLDKECFRLTNQKEKLEEQLDNQKNYMWEEYQLTYHMAIPFRTETSDSLLQVKKKIIELKNRIKNLGDVNINSIEDYKNLLERHELLKTQHNDIIKAEEILKGIILELDEEMRKQFEEKFTIIKKQFDIVFKELFGGGKGTLTLIEGEDVLEAGIRIIAQPPGKKLQNMRQLSGGEKALTAISLLFAIQKLKPSPFCLLDEIEAALDDSNVKRFAKYLHKLTKHTQFIMITHRRGTMEAADVLYGITMQEKGISTLVSVNLIKNDLDK
jgi:chromosome segregation protein